MAAEVVTIAPRQAVLEGAPLGYSIAWLTCAVTNRWTRGWLAGRVLLKIVYLLTCRVLDLAVLVFRGDRTKSELLVLSGLARKFVGVRPRRLGR